MLKFNICFIKQGSKVLLINRERPSWMGCWNGIGGKLEEGEEPRDSAIREVYEETGIDHVRLHFKGLITWSVDGDPGGMYTYMAELPEGVIYPTPVKTAEGILDWKTIDWIMHPENMGIARNIPKSIRTILFDPNCYDHHCVYENGRLIRHTSTLILPSIETDLRKRDQYLRKYTTTSSGIR